MTNLLTIIDTISDFYAPLYTFAYYEVDDIKQEIAIMCLEAYPKYNAAYNTSLLTFLSRHVRNRLLNLRRDKFTRPLECVRNPELCGRETESGERDCTNCRVFQAWQKRNMVKRQLAANIGVQEVDIEGEITNSMEDIGDMKRVVAMLEPEVKKLWERFKRGSILTEIEEDELIEEVLLCKILQTRSDKNAS